MTISKKGPDRLQAVKEFSPAVVKASGPLEHCAEGASTSHCDAMLIRAFHFLGKRWSGVILATLSERPLGFSELKRLVEGISDSVLSERLSELQAAGLVARDVQPGPPVTVTYQLSGAGQALTPAMRELTVWAQDNLPEEGCAMHEEREDQ